MGDAAASSFDGVEALELGLDGPFLAFARGLAPAKAPNPRLGPLMEGLFTVGSDELVGAGSSCLPPMAEPRLLGLIPPPAGLLSHESAEEVWKGEEAAAKAPNPDLLEDDEVPDEVGTALKGEALALKEENVG